MKHLRDALEEIAALPLANLHQAQAIARRALARGDEQLRPCDARSPTGLYRCTLAQGHLGDHLCQENPSDPYSRKLTVWPAIHPQGLWHCGKMREGAVCLLPVSHQGACVLTP